MYKDFDLLPDNIKEYIKNVNITEFRKHKSIAEKLLKKELASKGIITEKKKNYGKRFEANFEKSFNELYKDKYSINRKKDDTSGYKNVNNAYDFDISANGYNYYLELKSTKGKSMPFSMLRENQIKGLKEKTKQKNHIAGFIFNYRIDEDKELERTFFLDIDKFNEYVSTSNKKSINITDIEKIAIEIPILRTIKRTYKKTNKTSINYRYDLSVIIRED